MKLLMRAAFVLLMCCPFTVDCKGQETSLELTIQRIEIKDSALLEIINNLCDSRPDFFSSGAYYQITFYQSSWPEDDYFVSIDQFTLMSLSLYKAKWREAMPNEALLADSIKYCCLIHGCCFFLSGIIPQGVIEQALEMEHITLRGDELSSYYDDMPIFPFLYYKAKGQENYFALREQN